MDTTVSSSPAVPNTSAVNAFGWKPASPFKLMLRIVIVVGS
jgi:hypothetical protein